MFTGIIEAMGEVLSIDESGDLARLAVAAGELAKDVELGDSIAINGTCLTVTETDGSNLCFDAVRETLERTALGELSRGSRVNLERAMQLGARLDGHIVQGHVDGTGAVAALERDGDDVKLFVECPPEIADLLVDKGSVAIDGVALTVVAPGTHGFHVVLIPYTLEATTLGGYPVGHRLNLEVDVLGKYVRTYLERIVGSAQGAS